MNSILFRNARLAFPDYFLEGALLVEDAFGFLNSRANR